MLDSIRYTHQAVLRYSQWILTWARTPGQDGAVREHVDSCPPCVAYVETYQITIRLSRNLPQARLPPRLVQRLEEALRNTDEAAE